MRADRRRGAFPIDEKMAPSAGFKPATSPLGGVRSIQLSYEGTGTFYLRAGSAGHRFIGRARRKTPRRTRAMVKPD